MDLFGFQAVKISTVNDFVRTQIAFLADIYLREFNKSFPNHKLEKKDVKIEFFHSPDRDGAISMATIKIKTPYAWLVSGQQLIKDKIIPTFTDDCVKKNTYTYTISSGETQVCLGFNVRGFNEDVAALDKIPF